MDTIYSNEKVVFAAGEANLSLTNPYGDILSFFVKELKKIIGKNRKINLKILDVGCGAGSMTKTIKKLFPNLDVYGCDISCNAIKIAKKNSCGVSFFVADGTNIPFKNKKFNVVIMQSVLDHTDNPKKAVSEVNRVLKNKGTYLVSGPLEAEPTTIHGLLTYFKRFRDHRKRRCGHNFAFSKKSLLKLIRKGGFQIESVNSNWFIIAQLVDIFYYPFLEFFGKKPEQTINQYILNKNTFGSKIVKYLRSIFVIIIKTESLLIKPFNIGFYVFIKAIKNK